jgi:membrane protein DedA with SNARE-associated domain
MLPVGAAGAAAADRVESMSVAALFALAGPDMLLQAVLIVLGTFILEDAATVLAAMQVQSGNLPAGVALASLYAGIVLGDLGLYALGSLSRQVGWLRRLITPHRIQQGEDWLGGRVFKVVFISRFIPGLRLPTYTACGFLRTDWRRFALAAVVATLIWTSLLFTVSLKVGALLMEYLGTWRWAGAIGFALFVIVLGRTAARLQEAKR